MAKLRDPNRDMTIVRVERVIAYQGPRWWVKDVLGWRITGKMKMGEDKLLGLYIEEVSISEEVSVSAEPLKKG